MAAAQIWKVADGMHLLTDEINFILTYIWYFRL